MSNADIFEVLENERVIRDERNEVKALAQNTGIGVDSFTKDKIKEISDRIVKLKSKNEELIGRPQEQRDEQYKKIVEKETVDTENLFYNAQADHFINMLKGTNDVKVFVTTGETYGDHFDSMEVKLIMII